MPALMQYKWARLGNRSDDWENAGDEELRGRSRRAGLAWYLRAVRMCNKSFRRIVVKGRVYTTSRKDIMLSVREASP